MEEVWPTAHITELCLQLTAGSRPVNGDEHRALRSQSCERALLTTGHFTFYFTFFPCLCMSWNVISCPNIGARRKFSAASIVTLHYTILWYASCNKIKFLFSCVLNKSVKRDKIERVKIYRLKAVLK